MAKVIAQVAGGKNQAKEARTVGDLARKVNAEGFSAAVNGEPADDDQTLKTNDYVSFAKPVKAGK